MGIEQFPTDSYLKVCETGELVVAGGFQTARHEELRHIVMRLYKRGTRAGSERVRLKIYADDACVQLMAWSSWVALDDIPRIDEDQIYIGDVRFDFESFNVNKNRTYWLAIETDGYTRVQSSFFLGFLYDWPDPVYQQADAPSYALRVAIYGVAR